MFHFSPHNDVTRNERQETTMKESTEKVPELGYGSQRDWDFERSYNLDYNIDDGSDIPFIHNRYELASLLSSLYVIEDYMDSYEHYDEFYRRIENIVKGCYTIQACREYPVKFRFYKNSEEYELELRAFLLNLIAWRPYVELYGVPVLGPEQIMHMDTDIIGFDDYISHKIIIPLREHHVKSTIINNNISEVCYRFRQLVLDFSLIMNLSFGMRDIIEMYDGNEEIREIMESRYDDLSQPSEIEARLNKNQNRLIEILKEDPNNPIGTILRSGEGIKHKQLAEFLIAEGLKPTLDGKTIPFPIQNSTVLGGLDRPSYYFIDVSGARKSQINNKHVMGNAGWFGKILTELVRTLSMSKTVADCGSNHLVKYEIKTKKHLQKLNGKYYKEHPEDPEYKYLDMNKDKDLIGKTLYFRSAATCGLENEVCGRCVGTSVPTINWDIADGFGAFQTEETTKKINQDVLSTKHLLTTDSEEIIFSGGFSTFFTFNNSEIYPNVNNNEALGERISNYAIYISPKDTDKISEFDDDSLYNSIITNGHIYIRDLTGEEDDLLIKLLDKEGNENPREIYITQEAGEIMKKHKNTIPFSMVDDDTKLFEVVIFNNELTKPLYDMMNLINRNASTKDETIDGISQKMLDLMVEAGIGAMATSAEMIINRMIRDPEDIYKRPDFSQKILPKYQIVSARKALDKNKSPYIGLSFQYLKSQLTSDDLYTVRTATSYADPWFQTTVSMKNLKKYAYRISPQFKKDWLAQREEKNKGTFHDPEERKRFLEEVRKKRKIK